MSFILSSSALAGGLNGLEFDSREIIRIDTFDRVTKEEEKIDSNTVVNLYAETRLFFFLFYFLFLFLIVG